MMVDTNVPAAPNVLALLLAIPLAGIATVLALGTYVGALVW